MNLTLRRWLSLPPLLFCLAIALPIEIIRVMYGMIRDETTRLMFLVVYGVEHEE